ncbi:SusD/RagB family nutrient-binding outer membrane lipoprotein [Bizionia sp.]|uniref:SusD/RagB family nutrient-binding outer membrane lipoprotein n=2 Tax=unclassified Bizionia TaxID=2626393 RepID=UPI00204B87B0|nr:SusD/RagB family nutrient-binding outer membrane lipoprotein [Bizionia sp. M204]
MKNIFKLFSIVMLSVITVACSDDYLDVNTDPNNPLTTSPDLLLPVAQRYSAYTITTPPGGARRLNTLGNLMMYNWSQSDGYSWYQSEFEYRVNSTFYSTIWDYQYQAALKQYHTFDVDTENYEYYTAIAKIMKSFHFQILVDTYGDIPYFEALLRGENPTPAFDDALTVYEDLIVQLDNAIALINAGNANGDVLNPGGADIMYAGDMNEWKKFANTVKLRILVRQSDMAGRSGYLTTEFQKIANEGSGFITDNATANPGYTDQEDQQSPFWGNYGQTTAGEYVNNYFATCATPFVLDKLTDFNDPRIDYIYEEPEDGHLGVVQGLDFYPPGGLLTEPFVSNIGPGLLKSAEQNSVIFSLAEAEFLQAEAALKTYLSGAQQHYENGIAASFDYLGVPNAAGYYTQPIDLVSWGSTSNKLEAIITQKWIALNGLDAIQSWYDFSRTGYPSNLPISLLSPEPTRPVRLAYPSSEISGNGANVPAQPNVFTSKIFWAN